MTVSSLSSSLRVPPKAVLYLPVGLRVQLARFAVWRTRKAHVVKTSMLALCLALVSTWLGYLLSQPAPQMPVMEQATLGAAMPVADDEQASGFVGIEAQRWGQLQAEVLRLRLLFSRIVEAADLDGGEFALAVQLADERYLNSLSALEDTPDAAQQRFVLAKRAVDHMTTHTEAMLSITRQRHKERRFTLSGSPVVRASITSRFGYRLDPRTGRKRFHGGVDFGGRNGSKVLALADGIVTYSGKNGGYGNLIELEHINGYRTRYAHNEANLVEVGSNVSKGEVIATMGSTGRSTGTHVHIEVRADGRAIDPMRFISEGS